MKNFKRHSTNGVMDIRAHCHSLRRRVERLRRSVYPPQNGAIVRTDSVCTKACLQNSETCMRNLHW